MDGWRESVPIVLSTNRGVYNVTGDIYYSRAVDMAWVPIDSHLNRLGDQ